MIAITSNSPQSPPDRTVWAIKVLYLTVGLSILNFLLFYKKIRLVVLEQEEVPAAEFFLIIQVLFAFLVETLFIGVLESGIDWARSIFLMWCLCKSVGLASNFMKAPVYPIVSSGFDIFLTLCQYFAIYFLFSGESSIWFKKTKLIPESQNKYIKLLLLICSAVGPGIAMGYIAALYASYHRTAASIEASNGTTLSFVDWQTVLVPILFTTIFIYIGIRFIRYHAENSR